MFEYLLRREFEVKAPNQIWVSDITYVTTDEAWLYLATQIDLFNRKVVGMAMSASIKRPCYQTIDQSR